MSNIFLTSVQRRAAPKILNLSAFHYAPPVQPARSGIRCRGGKTAADICKRRAPIPPNGKAPASITTDGNGADAATVGKPCAKTPEGGCHAMLGGACCSLANCEAAAAGTRTLNPRGTITAGDRQPCRDGQVVWGTSGPVLPRMRGRDQHGGGILRHYGPVRMLRPVRGHSHAGARDCMSNP